MPQKNFSHQCVLSLLQKNQKKNNRLALRRNPEARLFKHRISFHRRCADRHPGLSVTPPRFGPNIVVVGYIFRIKKKKKIKRRRRRGRISISPTPLWRWSTWKASANSKSWEFDWRTYFILFFLFFFILRMNDGSRRTRDIYSVN